jgi:hypothetical protein
MGHGNPDSNLESPGIYVSNFFICLSVDSLILCPSLCASLHNKVTHLIGGKGFGKLLGLVIIFGLHSYNWGRKKKLAEARYK